MNFTANLKYFAQKKYSVANYIAFIISGILIGFGVYLFIASSSGAATFSVAFIAIGVAIVLITLGGKIKDSEIDESISLEIEEFKKRVTDHFLPVNTRKDLVQTDYRKKRCEFLYFSTYYFDNKDILVRKGRDNKVRSSIFCMNGIYLFTDEIAIGKQLLSLINEDSKETMIESLYTDLKSAELVQVENAKYSGISKYVYMRITKNDGSVFFETPVIADAEADSYVEQIQARITKAAKEKAKAAESEEVNFDTED